MQLVSNLSILNACLALMGELPVASLDDDHPYQATVDDLITSKLNEIQLKSWWFNTQVRTIQPDPSGEIHLPSNTVSCTVLKPYNKNLTQSYGVNKLFDLHELTFNIGVAVEAEVVLILPVEELPPLVQRYLEALVKYNFQLNYVAESAKTLVLANEVQETYNAVYREEFKLCPKNMLNSGHIGAMRFRQRYLLSPSRS